MLAHPTGVPQAPDELQVATSLSDPPSAPVTHSVVPCAHTPWHEAELPLVTHVWLPQLAGVPHWPFDPHVWRPLPEHWVAPGVQVPWHDATPDVTAHAELVHATGLPQAPVPSHVWTPLLEEEHWVEFGTHVPWHWPATHA